MSTAHLVLTDHDGEVVRHEAELLLQRLVRRMQLRQLRLSLLRPLLRCRRRLVQLGVLRVERGGVVLCRSGVPAMQTGMSADELPLITSWISMYDGFCLLFMDLGMVRQAGRLTRLLQLLGSASR